jgi:hypothetical protein
MNQHVQLVIHQVSQIRKDWDEWTVDGHDLIVSLSTLDTEMQYMNAPYWGVFKLQQQVQKQVSQKIVYQLVHSTIDLNNIVHCHMNELLEQLSNLCQQCEQNKIKTISRELLESKKRDSLSHCIQFYDRLISIIKDIRSSYLNDWNMKVMIVSDLKKYCGQEQAIFSTAHSEQEEDDSAAANEIQQKLTFYAQSWKLKPYLTNLDTTMQLLKNLQLNS